MTNKQWEAFLFINHGDWHECIESWAERYYKYKMKEEKKKTTGGRPDKKTKR